MTEKTRTRPTAQTYSAENETETEETAEHTCPECSNTKLKTDNGTEYYCPDCGLVVEQENIDYGPEWRAFNHQEQQEKSRVGSPQTASIHDKGLSTQISWQDKDAYGNSISSKKRRKMQRLRRWDEQSRTKNSKERNLRKALGEINRMTSALGLPDSVNETASVIYRRAVDEDLLIGRSIEGVATASVFCACRQSQIPRTLADMKRVSRVSKDKISSDYRYLSQKLQLELPPMDPVSFLPSVASDLGVASLVESEAENVLREYVEAGEHSGRHSKGVAAASIYTVNKLLGEEEQITQEDVADAAGVCVVTVRSRHEELVDYKDEISVDVDEVKEEEESNDEEQEDSEIPSVETDSVELQKMDEDNEYLVTVPETASQNEVLITVVDELSNKFGLFDEISVPYKAPNCRNYLIVEDYTVDAPDQNASWRELESGYQLNTKLGKDQKKRHMHTLAQEVGIEVRFDNNW